jgi:hypothetical protein
MRGRLFSVYSLIVLKWNSEAAQGGDRIGRLVVGLALVQHAEIVGGGVNISIHWKVMLRSIANVNLLNQKT